KVGTEVETLKVEIQAPARVTPADETHATKREGMTVKAAVGAGLGGLLLIVAAVSFFEFRTRRLVDGGQLSHRLLLPVAGTMPRPPVRGRGLPGADDSGLAAWNQLLTESADAARTVILHASRRTARRVVMITSAVGGEGKTMLSAHLAASLARAGWRTLLVDA